MANGIFIAYYRVSTDRQGKSGLGLDAQRRAVLDYLNGGNCDLAGEFTEVESGKRADRPQLALAIKEARRLRATLIIAKLDRLARNVAFVSNLMEAGVDFIAADNPNANRLTIHILAAVAEDEARRISERTRSALAAAKARGTALGGRRTNEQYVASIATRVAAADMLAANVAPIISDIQRSGLTSYVAIAMPSTGAAFPLLVVAAGMPPACATSCCDVRARRGSGRLVGFVRVSGRLVRHS